MKEIRGDAKSVRQLLSGAKYAVDYYQREYKWETKQVAELIDDLSDKFREDYEPGVHRSAVADFGHYFLGSIIISDREGQKFIIDGQQRLTSLTLLLIHLHHLLTHDDQKAQVAELIFSARFGQRSFNLDVPDRVACMEALYASTPFDPTDHSESVRNIVARFGDIEEALPTELTGEALPYFVDWLLENVHLVEITAYSDEDAYTIFETMNDRGLSLTPSEMLKGYLLANIDGEKRNTAHTAWKARVSALQEIGKDEDADGIKTWLRSQYAESIRERRRGASPKDFDLIGTEFHRWVRDHAGSLGLTNSTEFARFVERDFAYYTRWYERLRKAGEDLTPGLETVHFNAQYNFTLQYVVLLAAIAIGDADADALRKVRIAAAYIDILINRRIWNFRAIDYSTMQYAMFLVVREVRGRSAQEIADLLAARLGAEEETFAGEPRFSLHGMNRRQIHRMLARMTDFVETRSGMPSRYKEYVLRGRHSYEVEHIWANHFERHKHEFEHASDFQEHRNRIGGLLLLPKAFNASYGDLEYAKKLPHYDSHNLLARSLHEKAYQRNPGFATFLTKTGLPFRAHEQFLKSDLEERQQLMLKLAEQIWNPQRLYEELEA